MKKILIGAFLILVLGSGVLGYLYIQNTNVNPLASIPLLNQVSREPTADTLQVGSFTIEAKTDIPSYKLVLRQQILTDFLTKEGIMDNLKKNGVRSFDDGTFYHPQKVVILLTETPQDNFLIRGVNADGSYTNISTLGTSYDVQAGTYTLSVYINKNLLFLPPGSDINPSYVISSHVVRGLQIAASTETGSTKIVTDYQDLLGRVPKNFNAFSLEKL